MLIAPRTRIDDRNRTSLLPLKVVHQISTTFSKVTDLRSHDDQVKVTAEHANRIHSRFTLHFRRSFRVTDFVASQTKDLAGSHERKKRSRGWLREIQHRPFVSEQISQPAVALRVPVHFSNDIRRAAKLFQYLWCQLRAGNQMRQTSMTLKLDVLFFCRSLQKIRKLSEFRHGQLSVCVWKLIVAG